VRRDPATCEKATFQHLSKHDRTLLLQAFYPQVNFSRVPRDLGTSTSSLVLNKELNATLSINWDEMATIESSVFIVVC
jgi:hypothetical protein